MDRTVIIPEAPRGASQLIEIPVATNAQGKIPLPVVQQLQNDTTQNVIIKAIRLITASVLATAPVSGGATAPLTELQKISLTLYSQGWEKGQNIPILLLNDTYTEGSGTPWRAHATKLDDWTNVDWNKSFLQYSNGSVSAGAPYTVLIEVEYLRLDAKGQPIQGAN